MKFISFLLTLCFAGNLLAQNPAIDSLKLELLEARTDTASIKLSMQIAQKMIPYDPDSAHLRCQHAWKVIDQLMPGVLKVDALRKLGTTYYNLRERDTALFIFKEALEIAYIQEYQFGIGALLNNIGTVYKARKEYPDAIHYYEKSLELQQKIANEEGQTVALSNLGTIYMILQEWQKSRGIINKH